MTEIREWIDKAAGHDLQLNLSDFKRIDGEWTLDGMNPDEWIDAMTME